MKTLIRLIPKDQGLHCLPFHLHLLDTFLYIKINFRMIISIIGCHYKMIHGMQPHALLYTKQSTLLKMHNENAPTLNVQLMKQLTIFFKDLLFFNQSAYSIIHMYM